MSLKKDNRKRFAIIGAVAGFLTTSFGLRRLADEPEPKDIPGEGWKSVLIDTKDSIGEKNLTMLSAGIAYYSTLAFFPLLAAVVAIAALTITSHQLEDLILVAREYLPADISSIVADQLQNLVSRRSDNFLAAVIAILIALYGASGASKGLLKASYAVYGTKSSRSWLMQQLIGIGWTLAGIALGITVLAFMAINQSLLSSIGVPEVLSSVLLFVRWIVILLATVSGIAIFYRFGPGRQAIRWRWILLSSSLVTVAWIVATSVFFSYLQNFANYTQSYSLFAGIIALMVWTNLSALILLVGVELNHQLERRSYGRRPS